MSIVVESKYVNVCRMIAKPESVTVHETICREIPIEGIMRSHAAQDQVNDQKKTKRVHRSDLRSSAECRSAVSTCTSFRFGFLLLRLALAMQMALAICTTIATKSGSELRCGYHIPV